MRIGIDPGHGGFDSGAIGRITGLYEKDVTLAISLELARILQEHGLDIMLTRGADVAVSRTKNTTQELIARTHALNTAKCDYAISVHVNSSTNTRANYIATFIQGVGGQAEQLAKKVQPQLVQATGWSDGGVRIKNLHMTRETTMPTILCECGFISNADQEKQLRDPETQKKIAGAIATGVLRFLGLPKRESTVAKTPCTINIKGKEFPGYLEGGSAYFGEGVKVRDVVEAINSQLAWDAKAMTVKIS